MLTCTGCDARVNPETAWPGVCRLVVDEKASAEWPQLTREGHFLSHPVAAVYDRRTHLSSSDVEGCKDNSSDGHRPPLQDESVALRAPIPYSPDQTYALCCPECGALLDRENLQWHAQAPEKEPLRRWSYRLSQLLIPAIDLDQIVAAWQLAIRDPDHMTVFCTDRLALPKSTTQTLTPAILEAARGDYVLGKEQGGNAEDRPFSLFPSSFSLCYAGLDMGDQCWFVARAVDPKAPHLARLLWVEPIAAERVRTRVPELFRQLNLRALCVDAGPLRDLSRDLVFQLNNLDEDSVPSSDDPTQNIHFNTTGHRDPSGGPGYLLPGSRRLGGATGNDLPQLHWHAASQTWRQVRAMAVEFTQREGHGLRHKLARTQDGRLYPLLAANRDETIQRIVQELLPPEAGDPRLIELADGTTAAAPTQRFFLPRATEETRSVLDTYERHLLAGARQERTPDGRTLRYLDKCENHFLLATAYAALAELIATETTPAFMPPIRPLPMTRPHQNRSLTG